MAIINLVQGSDEWHKKRNSSITGSEVSVLMGNYPYDLTPLKMYRHKLGLEEYKPKNTFVMERGHEHEPKARAMASLATGIDFNPCCVQWDKNPWCFGSLDGYNEEANVICEIKSVGKSAFDDLETNNKIPDHHIHQMQFYLMITGAKLCYYVAYNADYDKICVRNVEPAPVLMEEIFAAAEKFWKCLQEKREPEVTDKDYREITDSKLANLILKWKRLKYELTKLEKDEDELRDLIETMLPYERCRMQDVSIQKIYKVGAIDYKKVPELSGVDLEKYRKPGSSYFQFKVKESE
jgi:putative phage-type endonuclease